MNFQNLRIGKLNLKIEILKFENDRLNFEIMNFINYKLLKLKIVELKF